MGGSPFTIKVILGYLELFEFHERPSLLANTEILYILAPYRKLAALLNEFPLLEYCRSSCDIPSNFKDRKKATKNQVKRVTTHRSPTLYRNSGKNVLTRIRIFPREKVAKPE